MAPVAKSGLLPDNCRKILSFLHELVLSTTSFVTLCPFLGTLSPNVQPHHGGCISFSASVRPHWREASGSQRLSPDSMVFQNLDAICPPASTSQTSSSGRTRSLSSSCSSFSVNSCDIPDPNRTVIEDGESHIFATPDRKFRKIQVLHCRQRVSIQHRIHEKPLASLLRDGMVFIFARDHDFHRFKSLPCAPAPLKRSDSTPSSPALSHSSQTPV